MGVRKVDLIGSSRPPTVSMCDHSHHYSNTHYSLLFMGNCLQAGAISFLPFRCVTADEIGLEVNWFISVKVRV